MDAPRRRLQMRGGFAGLQLPAGVRTGVRVRRGLADQSSFVRTVEGEADAAQDQSKLAHDFGQAAVSPRTNRVIAAIQQKEATQKKEHHNALVEAASLYANQDI